jgi:cation diffusion facilitator family transporter
MHAHSIDNFRHEHIFLGSGHDRNERRSWIVIGICGVMMVAEIGGGALFGSMALIADGLHMSTHAGALFIAALAYTYARRLSRDDRFTFGTGKLGDLAAFSSAIALAMIALLIGYESINRLFHPVHIAFNQAIPIAFLGLFFSAPGFSGTTMSTSTPMITPIKRSAVTSIIIMSITIVTAAARTVMRRATTICARPMYTYWRMRPCRSWQS